MSLNPYCSGRKNRMKKFNEDITKMDVRLNPYCSGRKNRMALRNTILRKMTAMS